MSLDRIIRIHITSESLPMAQAGFGIPLILGFHEHWPERVHAYSTTDELLNDGFKTNDPIYLAAQKIMTQQPSVTTFKVGRREKPASNIVADLGAVVEEDSAFYGLLLAPGVTKDILAAADWVEDKRFLFGTDIFDVKTLNPADQRDLGTRLKQKGYRRTFSVFNSDKTSFLSAAFMGKVFPHSPGSSSWAFQRLSAVEPSPLRASAETALDEKNVNRYTGIKGVGITLQGKVCSGEYIDTIRGIDWLHACMQERLFVLMVKNKKIPFTEKGVDLVRSEIMAQLDEAVFTGVLAAEPKPSVTAPAIENISPLDKSNRVLPNVRFTGRLQGAVHAIQIEGTVAP